MPIARIILAGLVQYGPEIAQTISNLLHKPDPKKEDFDALFRAVKSYEEIVTNSKIPKGM